MRPPENSLGVASIMPDIGATLLSKVRSAATEGVSGDSSPVIAELWLKAKRGSERSDRGGSGDPSPAVAELRIRSWPGWRGPGD